MSPRRRHQVAALDDRAALQAGSLWWAYLRHSPGETQDLASQRRAVREFAEGRGLLVVRYFADAGQSGSSTEGRSAFDALIEASRVQPRPVAGLLLWAFSRLARNELDAQFYKADLRRRGYAIVSVTEEIPADVGLIVESVIDFANRKLLETITKDTRRGLRETVLRELQVDGRTVRGFSGGGFPPRGYRAVRVQTGTRRNGEPRYNSYWEVDPAWQERVARARRLFAEGESIAGLHESCRLFRDVSAYRDFLRNPTYSGQRRCGDVVVEGAHPPYDDPEQRVRIAARVGSYQPRSRGGQTVTSAQAAMLSGIAFCGECGEPLHSSAHPDGDYYRCASKDSHRRRRRVEADPEALGFASECPSRRILAKLLDGAIVDLLERELLTGPNLRRLVEALNAERQGVGRSGDREKAELGREGRKLGREIGHLVDFIGEGRASDAVARTLAEKELRQREIAARLQAIDHRLKVTRPLAASDDELAEIAAGLREQLKSAQERVLWALVRVYAARVEVFDEHARVFWTFPLDSLGTQGPSSGLVSYPQRGRLITRSLPLEVRWERPRRGRIPGTVQTAPTVRQAEVARLRASGLTWRVIGQTLGVSAQAACDAWRRGRRFREV